MGKLQGININKNEIHAGSWMREEEGGLNGERRGLSYGDLQCLPYIDNSF